MSYVTHVTQPTRGRATRPEGSRRGRTDESLRNMSYHNKRVTVG